MADTPTTDVEKIARGTFTVALQFGLLLAALLVMYWVRIQPYTGEEGPPDILSCLLFIGGLYALSGAVIQVLAHKRTDVDDYWGKQLVLAGATVALIGATASVPAFLFVATISAFAVGGIAIPVLILGARWLRHRPPGCSNETVRKDAPRVGPASPGSGPRSVPGGGRPAAQSKA